MIYFHVTLGFDRSVMDSLQDHFPSAGMKSYQCLVKLELLSCDFSAAILLKLVHSCLITKESGRQMWSQSAITVVQMECPNFLWKPPLRFI